MFKVGETYDIEVIDASDDDGQPLVTTYPGRSVQDQQGGLIKINDGKDGHIIINTGSPGFFRATLRQKR